MLWLTLGACVERTIVLDGIVYQSHDPLSGALAEAEVRIVDFEGGEIVTLAADGDGVFHATLPEGIAVFVEITAADYAVSTFPGTIGLEPVQTVEDHALYGVSEAERADWSTRFEGCPGADTDGAVVFGEMRLDGFLDPLTGGAPTIGTGTALVSDGEGDDLLGCYFDAEGALYDPEAAFTGATGKFAVFGVEPGLQDFQIEGEVTTDVSTIHVYPVWIPDRERVVAPWFPALLPNVF